MISQYKAALYMRLSRDDGNKESSGIESQRLMLSEFANAHGIEIFGEYIDDGYSGTVFDRPSFCRMLEDIEDGRINTVIVKDMSRLGRNYIATGELTEVYFPEHLVRFIAINDGYDSKYGTDDMTPFRHVINEMYARDISRKIRSALYAKMRDGQYIGSFAPYGYKKSEDNKNMLVPDPDTSETVKLIFTLKASGDSTKTIAEKLNGRHILIPLDQRLRSQNKPTKDRKWTQSGICKILRNQVYLGHTVQGKSIKPTMRSKRSQSKKREDHIVVKNTHTPLVSEELFFAATNKK